MAHERWQPVMLLDTGIGGISEGDWRITHLLHRGDTVCRFRQEWVQGGAGACIPKVFGVRVHLYHLNWGYSALLTL